MYNVYMAENLPSRTSGIQGQGNTMSVQHIAASREACVNKAIAQVRFISFQKNYLLDESDLGGLIKAHGVAVMAKAMATLKPIDLGKTLSFGASFIH